MSKDKKLLAMLESYRLDDAIAAGYSLSALRAAGYPASALRAAGYSLSALLADAPLLEKPYTRLWADIQAKRRTLDQSTFGNASPSEPNICGTAMCTAGHLVNMAGEAGWKLKEKYGYATAAALIHEKAHPGWPCQNFGGIPDEWALAYIEEMAAREAEEGEKP